MYVIGTAGHVDHGKTTLVKAITGIDPDRLLEEKQRQMTIDLGYAWLALPDGTQVGIVDVPGHRDFIENMLAGIGGIDAVLMVIAADEGVMPQTREHLAIVDLLKIKAGIIVLTKVDLIKDPEWLDLVEQEIKQLLNGTVLEKAPFIRLSSLTGEGIEELKAQISRTLCEIEPRVCNLIPRLPIDRVFSISGFGTVVTGTLAGGVMHTGDTVQIQPSGITARIRGIQTYQKTALEALPGNRTAINISGVNVSDIRRGDVLTLPGKILPTSRVDCAMEVLKDANVGIKHNESIKFFTGTSERIGRIRLLQKTRIDPGDSGFVQIEFSTPVVLLEGDRFIFRRISPAETLGGGQVLDANPSGRYKLKEPAVINRLTSRLDPSTKDYLLDLIDEQGYVFEEAFRKSFQNTGRPGFDQQLEALISTKKVISLSIDKGEMVFFTAAGWGQLTGRMLELISNYHHKNPLMPGFPISSLQKRLDLPQKILETALRRWKEDSEISVIEGLVSLPDFKITFSTAQKRRYQEAEELLESNPYNTPPVKKLKEIMGEELFESSIKRGFLIQVSPDVVFRDSEYKTMLTFVVRVCMQKGLLEIQDIKDKFQTSRKYVLAFLEHLDAKGVTRRDGEGRKLINIPAGLSDFQDSH